MIQLLKPAAFILALLLTACAKPSTDTTTAGICGNSAILGNWVFLVGESMIFRSDCSFTVSLNSGCTFSGQFSDPSAPATTGIVTLLPMQELWCGSPSKITKFTYSVKNGMLTIRATN